MNVESFAEIGWSLLKALQNDFSRQKQNHMPLKRKIATSLDHNRAAAFSFWKSLLKTHPGCDAYKSLSCNTVLASAEHKFLNSLPFIMKSSSQVCLLDLLHPILTVRLWNIKARAVLLLIFIIFTTLGDGALAEFSGSKLLTIINID